MRVQFVMVPQFKPSAANSSANASAANETKLSVAAPRYYMVNMGKGSLPPPAEKYISFEAGDGNNWIRSAYTALASAMPVQLLPVGTPAPPPAPTPCSKRFDFRRLGGPSAAGRSHCSPHPCQPWPWPCAARTLNATG